MDKNNVNLVFFEEKECISKPGNASGYLPVFECQEEGYWEPQPIGGGTGLSKFAISCQLGNSKIHLDLSRDRNIINTF